MRTRAFAALLVVISTGAFVATEALSQEEIRVQERSFAWTGKSGQNANYRWTATVSNPSNRAVNVRVSLEILDGQGDVVARDDAEVVLPTMDQTSVQRSGSLAFASAERATQYRVVLTQIE